MLGGSFRNSYRYSLLGAERFVLTSYYYERPGGVSIRLLH